MTPEPKSPADVDEQKTVERYLRMRRLAEIVREAARRADAQRRLNYALRASTR